jgi:hypothetical protein
MENILYFVLLMLSGAVVCMALNTKMADDGVDAEADALAAELDAGWIDVMDGTQPATGDTAITDQNVLAELRFGNPAFDPAVAGVITAKAIAPDTDANATGQAKWFRTYKSDHVTPVMDGSAGTSGCNLNLNSDQIQVHAEVSVTSFVHTVTK